MANSLSSQPVEYTSLQNDSASVSGEPSSSYQEQLVMVEFTGIIDSDILRKCDKKCKILGINTEMPFLQVDKYVFVGEYEDVLGTCVIFEEISNQVDGDRKPQLKYKCHTMKKLNMTRTFLTEKKDHNEGGGKIEWFQIKDSVDSPCWSNMICSFAQENDEDDESQSDEQLDGSNEDGEHLDQGFELEKQDSKIDERTDCENEGTLESEKDSEIGESASHSAV
ncbi:hypothetical protein GDO86_006057 [Hymenochirus boettgeri]|uniref:General transcription factor 3C polypeptide 6 n=1 Tax=Hymenochirus boettgeri TaxID=247094 RepID=A0A8T2J9I8_9PIPI|nr:hypothetical protein GDO86_006057 [Hymenochirus boettgeri]